MLHIVLFNPEIPPNTGNIIRLAANTGCQLHLVEPLGFPLDDTKMKRAGLDYHEYAEMKVHPDWETCAAALPGKRMFALTTKGSKNAFTASFQDEDVLVFGPETRGLPADLLATFGPDFRLRLPMQPTQRSLNLSNTVAIMVYEALRQTGFQGMA